MSDDVTWKSTEILKVFGTTLRTGTFKGGKSVEGGEIVSDSPTTFTPSYIARIYENISTHVPLYIDHSTANRKPIGYAYKFGVTNSLDDIRYNGFVFDGEGKQKIMLEGYTSVSPEIDNDNRLTGIAFVRNPAITGTDVSAEYKVFSNEQVPMTETVVTEQGVGKEEVEVTQVTQPTIEQPKQIPINQSSPTLDAMIAEMKGQIADYKSKLEVQSAKTEQLLTSQYNALSSEIKSLGVDDPGKIVHGLPTEQKIAVLSRMKESMVKNKPMVKPAEDIQQVDEKSSVDKAVKEVCDEIGLTTEEYEKYLGKR